MTYTVDDGNGGTDTGDLTVTVGPDVTAPIVGTPTVIFGTGRVNETAPLRINWLAFDPASGVARYQVQVSVGGKPFATIYNGPATSVRKLFPFRKTLVFRVRAADHAGNLSAWDSATRKIVAIQNGSTRVTYKAAAWTGVRMPASSALGYSYIEHHWPLSAQATFTGRSVLYVAPKTRLSGLVKVYVDGTLIGRFNLHSSLTHLGRVIVRLRGPRAARTGSGSSTTTGRQAANLDAFIVLR